MKRLIGERRQAAGLNPDGPALKERRKAYYHGKYSKRVISLLFFVSAIVAFLVAKQIV